MELNFKPCVAAGFRGLKARSVIGKRTGHLAKVIKVKEDQPCEVNCGGGRKLRRTEGHKSDDQTYQKRYSELCIAYSRYLAPGFGVRGLIVVGTENSILLSRFRRLLPQCPTISEK